MGTIIVVVLVVLLLGGGGWGYSNYGYRGGFGIGAPLLIIIVLLLLLGCDAHAAETVAVQAPSIDLTAIILGVIGGVFAVIKIVAESFAASRIKDAAARAVVDKALDNSLGAIQQAAQLGVITAKPHLNVPGVPEGLQAGVQYVLDHAGDEAARLSIDPQAIADKINARLGLANIATNLAVSASAAPVVVKPLDPVPAVVAAG